MPAATTSTATVAPKQTGDLPQFIPAARIRARLAISRPSFDNLVARGCFGECFRFGEGRNSARYFLLDAVEAYIAASSRKREHAEMEIRAKVTRLLRK